MSTHLTPGQQALIEAELQARQRALAQAVSEQHGGRSRVEHARDVLSQDGDDAPQRDADREVDLARTDQAAQDLAGIEAALERLRTGRYGLCTDCEAVIPYDRLLNQPQALRCVACQAAYEGRHGGVPARQI